MQSSLTNKAEKQCILLAFILRIYHDTRSSKCQKLRIKFSLSLSLLTHYTSGHSVFDGVGGAYVSNSADYLKLTWQLEWTADRPKQKR